MRIEYPKLSAYTIFYPIQFWQSLFLLSENAPQYLQITPPFCTAEHAFMVHRKPTLETAFGHKYFKHFVLLHHIVRYIADACQASFIKSGVICLLDDCCFSEFSTIKIQLSVLF